MEYTNILYKTVSTDKYNMSHRAVSNTGMSRTVIKIKCAQIRAQAHGLFLLHLLTLHASSGRQACHACDGFPSDTASSLGLLLTGQDALCGRVDSLAQLGRQQFVG